MSAPPVNNPLPLSEQPPLFQPASRAAVPERAPAKTDLSGSPRTAAEERGLGAGAWVSGVGTWMDESGAWAWLSSAAVHAVLLVVLSLILLASPSQEPLWVAGAFNSPVNDLEMDLDEIPLDPATPSLGPFENSDEIAMPGPRSAAIGSAAGTSSTPRIGNPFSADRAWQTLTASEAIGNPLESLAHPLASRGGGLEGRKLANRRAAALAGGGTEQSEAAVEAALRWLAVHQWPDGGWRFDLEECPHCGGECRNSGNHKSTTAATGLALLCFLGAGYTHQDGKYQEVVSRGLYYLNEHMTITSHGGDLRDKGADLELEVPVGGLLGPAELAAARRDSMYSQGIAGLALTEAYAMTRDRGLRQPAEEAVKFIINAQYDDGGWRYAPRWEVPMGGDATVTGWQVAVLKSASLAGIDVPYEVWMKISDFLDGIQLDGGAKYLYIAGDRANRQTAATPIGLLCRMVGGWPKVYRPLQRGAAQISNLSPDRKDMYFNYYASQVLHHLGGPNWEKWNPKMRQYLIESQATEGHEAGSWYFSEPHSSSGGRLYTTAMAAMTLEVYYRYMPLYQETFVDRAPMGAVDVEP